MKNNKSEQSKKIREFYLSLLNSYHFPLLPLGTFVGIISVLMGIGWQS